VTRIPARLLVDLILRSAASQRGFAMVLAHGDDHGGAILIQCCERGIAGPMFERDFDGRWASVGPAADAGPGEQAAYAARRRKIDPDMWVIELDIADAPRFVANLNTQG
jgi:hypothetical protein